MEVIKIERMKVVKKKLNKMIFVVLGLLLLLTFIAIFAENLILHNPNETMPKISLEPPCSVYPFGTDAFGRCVYSRVVIAVRTSIIPALIIVFISGIVGSFIGLFSGYYGGVVDSILMRITDLVMAFPSLLLAIFIAGLMGGGVKNAALALLFVYWTGYARIVRSSVITIKQELYIKAAKLSGCSDFEILFSHILPNILSLIIVTMSLQISSVMISLSGLSFLGLGSPLPKAEWGSMVSENVQYIQMAPWTLLFPCLAIVLSAFLFNLLGDLLREQFSI